MRKYLAVIFLLVVGFGVGMVSLYFSSLTGVMTKLGLVGGDLSRDVNTPLLSYSVRAIDDQTLCDPWAAIAPIPQYLFGNKLSRISLGFALGDERVTCGVRYVLGGNAERGVYTLLKGLYYTRASYLTLTKIIPSDISTCGLVTGDTEEPWTLAYLSATRGSLNTVVDQVYRDIQVLRQQVAEQCTVDEPHMTF